jgi:hypothetical protein
VTVSANTQLDPTQNDPIKSITLFVDRTGNAQLYSDTSDPGCVGQEHCSSSFQWKVATLQGEDHTLQVIVTTQGGQSILSPVETVHLFWD